MKILLLLSFLIYCYNTTFSQNVDEVTPENVQPNNPSIGGTWKLDFSDEFNGTTVNENKWQIDHSLKSRAPRPNIGIYDWRWKPENVSVENGNLILKVYKTNGSSMTNGSVNSSGKYLTKYGYFEARIKVGDASKGTHTAFWLQGPNMGNVDGTANDGAEIDIFETAWTGDYTKSVVHIDGYGADHQANTKQYNTPGIHSGFHTWGFHWTENFMDIYYDGVFKVRYSDSKWVVKSLEYLWLSNGASFGLSGDEYFKDLPLGYLTETQVDYIRVWKEQSPTDLDDTLLKQDTWQLVMVDSEDNEGVGNPAINAFDDNPNTFWFTDWANDKPTHPHEIQIDLGETAKIDAFKYLPRQDGKTNGNIIQYEFYAGNDTSNWGIPITSGTLSGDNSLKTINFNETIECRYVRLVALADVNNTPFTNVGEIHLKGYYLSSSLGVNNTTKTDFSIFPNPIQDKIKIKWNTQGAFETWKIHTITGLLLKEGAISTTNNYMEIDTNNFDSGIYILTLDGVRSKESKLVIKD